MYAVIQTGGKQYRVSPGDVLKIEKMPGSAGDPVSFDQVLLASDGDKVDVGTPFLDEKKVTGQIRRHGKNRKVR